MSNCLISVVVPVYNTSAYLDKCVTSIVNQAYSNLEILLIDDGSTDNSGELCDEWAKKDKRIKVFHKKNGGLSDAKNFGIEHAKGELLSFVDSDDWIEPDMYQSMHHELKRNNANMIICGRFLDYYNSTIEQNIGKTFFMDSRNAIIRLNSFCGFDMSSCDKLYETSLFRGIRFPIGKKCEDAYVTYKILAAAKKIEYFSQSFYHYLQRNNSISKSHLLNMDLVYAAVEQMDFVRREYRDIGYAAETGYAFSVKSMYEIAIERNIKVNNELRFLKKDIKKYKKPILKNSYLSNRKKIVFFLFNDFYLFYFLIKKVKCMLSNKNMVGR